MAKGLGRHGEAEALEVGRLPDYPVGPDLIKGPFSGAPGRVLGNVMTEAEEQQLE